MAAPLDVSPVEAGDAGGRAGRSGADRGTFARPDRLGTAAARQGGDDWRCGCGVSGPGGVIGPHLTQSPNTFHQDLIDPTFSRPTGPFGGISAIAP